MSVTLYFIVLAALSVAFTLEVIAPGDSRKLYPAQRWADAKGEY